MEGKGRKERKRRRKKKRRQRRREVRVERGWEDGGRRAEGKSRRRWQVGRQGDATMGVQVPR